MSSIVTRYSAILPFATLALCSTTCSPVMPRIVLLARSSPSWTAASKLLVDAAVILLDEPFAAVDAPTVSTLLDQVTRWHQEGRTVIAVLHDLDLVRARFPSTLVLAGRCLAWGATAVALPAMAA